MTVVTPATRSNRVRLVAAAAFAAVVALGVVTAGHVTSPRGDEATASATLVPATSAAYLDFAHGAFDRFRDAPPAADFDAAQEAGQRPSPI